MARSVWTGTLSFGLVSIPVSLFPATESKDVRFHLFDREGRRVRYRRVVQDVHPLAEPTEGDQIETEPTEHPATAPDMEPAVERPASVPEAEVPYEDLVRGYEVEPETFVFLEREEIERARPTPSRTIDLEQFVELEDIDPVFFEKAYYVVPAAGAEKPYALLLEALRQTGRVGIGRFVLRTKPHLVAIRPMDGALGLETLFFGDEVRPVPSRVKDAGGVAAGRELDMAKQLVEMLAAEWEPSNFADEYREELLRIISERAPERIEEERPPAASSRIDDLMDALRQSVEEAKQARGSKPRRRTG